VTTFEQGGTHHSSRVQGLPSLLPEVGPYSSVQLPWLECPANGSRHLSGCLLSLLAMHDEQLTQEPSAIGADQCCREWQPPRLVLDSERSSITHTTATARTPYDCGTVALTDTVVPKATYQSLTDCDWAAVAGRHTAAHFTWTPARGRVLLGLHRSGTAPCPACIPGRGIGHGLTAIG
jgi:hypothetical protein